MTLGPAIPALPMSHTATTIRFYRDRMRFAVLHETPDFAVVSRDECVLHLWLADDASWRSRAALAARPICSGAESFLAGTASCRIQVDDEAALAGLYDELRTAGVLHPASTHGVTTTDFGDRELHGSDPDGNLLSFYWRPGSQRPGADQA